MNNAEMPINPVTLTNINGYALGLTKREHFASMALQGILSANEGKITANYAHMAVRVADALLNELEQNK